MLANNVFQTKLHLATSSNDVNVAKSLGQGINEYLSKCNTEILPKTLFIYSSQKDSIDTFYTAIQEVKILDNIISMETPLAVDLMNEIVKDSVLFNGFFGKKNESYFDLYNRIVLFIQEFKSYTDYKNIFVFTHSKWIAMFNLIYYGFNIEDFHNQMTEEEIKKIKCGEVYNSYDFS